MPDLAATMQVILSDVRANVIKSIVGKRGFSESEN